MRYPDAEMGYGLNDMRKNLCREGAARVTVLYAVKIGCRRRMPPYDYPLCGTLRSVYRGAKNSGAWDKMMKCQQNLAATIFFRLTNAEKGDIMYSEYF